MIPWFPFPSLTFAFVSHCKGNTICVHYFFSTSYKSLLHTFFSLHSHICSKVKWKHWPGLPMGLSEIFLGKLHHIVLAVLQNHLINLQVTVVCMGLSIITDCWSHLEVKMSSMLFFNRIGTERVNTEWSINTAFQLFHKIFSAFIVQHFNIYSTR